MHDLEQEQYALVNYLIQANPCPVLRQIAEDRIRWLESKKQNYGPLRYYPVDIKLPRVSNYEYETVGHYKKASV